MNKQASKEWLIKSWYNLSTAQLLYKEESHPVFDEHCLQKKR
ncbi:MAG: hypothetical protein U9N59_15545 [Campylobacterota bacterium]|nr:hypothetical protein [Campylobacterota bacterium]